MQTVPGTHKEISKLILEPKNQLSKQILPTKQFVKIKNSLHKKIHFSKWYNISVCLWEFCKLTCVSGPVDDV